MSMHTLKPAPDAAASEDLSAYWRARPSSAGPGRSGDRGRGLFAYADIAAGELIDRACTVEIAADQSPALDQMHPIGDFYFEHPADRNAGLMAFGLMSLLNHSSTPNAHVRFHRHDEAGWLIDLVATKAIAVGEEITYRYKCSLWFEAAS